MDNIILEDNLSLNLYVVLTTCYVVIILEDQSSVRKGLLANLN